MHGNTDHITFLTRSFGIVTTAGLLFNMAAIQIFWEDFFGRTGIVDAAGFIVLGIFVLVLIRKGAAVRQTSTT